MSTASTELEFGSYGAARAWIERTFPTAQHVGMGSWKVARTVDIYYGVGRVIVTPMRGHSLAEFGLA